MGRGNTLSNLLERIASILTPKECRELQTYIELIHASPDKKVTDVPSREKTFDLTVIYQMYPRKLGKVTGLNKLGRRIKSQESYDRCFAAVANYAEHCKRENLEEKYIMHFSTWVSKFEDWIPNAEDRKKELTPDFSGLFKAW